MRLRPATARLWHPQPRTASLRRDRTCRLLRLDPIEPLAVIRPAVGAEVSAGSIAGNIATRGARHRFPWNTGSIWEEIDPLGALAGERRRLSCVRDSNPESEALPRSTDGGGPSSPMDGLRSLHPAPGTLETQSPSEGAAPGSDHGRRREGGGGPVATTDRGLPARAVSRETRCPRIEAGPMGAAFTLSAGRAGSFTSVHLSGARNSRPRSLRYLSAADPRG